MPMTTHVTGLASSAAVKLHTEDMFICFGTDLTATHGTGEPVPYERPLAQRRANS